MPVPTYSVYGVGQFQLDVDDHLKSELVPDEYEDRKGRKTQGERTPNVPAAGTQDAGNATAEGGFRAWMFTPTFIPEPISNFIGGAIRWLTQAD